MAEENFAAALASLGVKSFVREHVFYPGRRWRFDFAWPSLRLAAEIEGGIFNRGRHVSPRGFIADAEKYNSATRAGWRVMRFPVVGGWDQVLGNARWLTELIVEIIIVELERMKK